MKKILITGAAGSVGSALFAYILKQGNYEHITCVDQSEEGLFWLQKEFGNKKIEYILKNSKELSLQSIQHHDIVIHTAAYKHVAFLEFQTEAAIRNNVGVTAVLSGLCWQAKKHFVFISTDKAIEAKSVMGKTKWVAERGVDSWRHLGLKTTIIRFANVLNSSGSVLQIWDRQRGKIEVTRGHRRWFITPEQAAQNICLAIEKTNKQNYLFAIKPDKETEIENLALDYAKANNCEIRIVDPKPGEKQAEVFCHENQYLEPIEGILYTIRRKDIEDSLCIPGEILPLANANSRRE